MRQYKTEAVILDTTDVFDSDRSLLIFSRELGKIRARARGVRKPTSKLTGHLLEYLPTQLELVESGGWFLIVQAQLLNKYATSSAYPEAALPFLKQAAILAESINRLFIDNDPHPAIYDGLVYTLDRLREQAGSEVADLLVAEIIWKSLAELGYQPQLQQCVLTGAELQEDSLAWSSVLGGVLSAEGYQKAAGEVRRITSGRTLVTLRQLLRPQFMAEHLRMPAEVQKETVALIYDYAQTIIGQPLRSVAA